MSVRGSNFEPRQQRRTARQTFQRRHLETIPPSPPCGRSDNTPQSSQTDASQPWPHHQTGLATFAAAGLAQLSSPSAILPRAASLHFARSSTYAHRRQSTPKRTPTHGTSPCPTQATPRVCGAHCPGECSYHRPISSIGCHGRGRQCCQRVAGG